MEELQELTQAAEVSQGCLFIYRAAGEGMHARHTAYTELHSRQSTFWVFLVESARINTLSMVDFVYNLRR